VAAYYQDEGKYPGSLINTAATLKSSLGVSVPISVKYIAAASVAAGTGVITFTAMGTGEPLVDAKTIVLSPSTTAVGAIDWVYSGGTVAQAYLPKK
jgi:hypothetical protein